MTSCHKKGTLLVASNYPKDIEKRNSRISFLLSLSKDVIPPPLEDDVLGSFLPFVCLNCCSRTSLILQRIRIVLKN